MGKTQEDSTLRSHLRFNRRSRTHELGAISTMDIICDWLNIYRWKELYVTVTPIVAFIGVVLYFCFALTLTNPVKSLMIYGLMAVLIVAVAAVNPKGRC